MNTSSAEVVAGRAVAVIAIERLVRERTALPFWTVAVVAPVLAVGAIVSDGLGAVILGLFAVVALAVALTLFTVRAVVLRIVRRVAGGPGFASARAVVERHIAEIERAGAVLPLDIGGVVRLAWLARRPAELRTHVQQTATTVARALPAVAADVRRALGSPERGAP